MTIRLNGQTSGYVELEAPNAAGSNTLVLPTGNGSSGQYLQTNGSGTLSWQTVADTNTGLVKTVSSDIDITGASTFNMTGIDADAEEIIMYWNGFYTSGSNHWHFRFGTEESGGTIYTTGYQSHGHYSASTSGHSWQNSLLDFPGAGSTSTNTYAGMIHISKRKDYMYHFVATTSHVNAGYYWQNIGTWTANSALTKIQWIVAGGVQTISGGTAQIATFAEP